MPNTSERQLDYMEKSDLYDEFVAARSKSPRARAKLTPARSKFPQGSVDQKHRQSKLPLAARKSPRTCSICGVCCVGVGPSDRDLHHNRS